LTFVSSSAAPVRYPTIYDLHKKQHGSNLPSDLISGSKWISPITRKSYPIKDEKTKSYMKTEMDYYPIFSKAVKKDQLPEKIANAHFRELDRRAYEDFLSSSRTNWAQNAPTAPPPSLKIEIPKSSKKRRMLDSGIGSSTPSPF
jgi:hypothetical protein